MDLTRIQGHKRRWCTTVFHVNLIKYKYFCYFNKSIAFNADSGSGNVEDIYNKFTPL